MTARKPAAETGAGLARRGQRPRWIQMSPSCNYGPRILLPGAVSDEILIPPRESTHGTMNLLPKSHKEFSSAEYWEKFFKKRGNKAFEWYGEYPQLCGLLHKYVKCGDKVLVVGCGNSSLSADMYDVGYHNIVNVDISDVVIRQMTEKHAKDRPDMTFAKMDILNMSEFADGEFSVVLDKGTLDAMATDESEATQAKVCQMFDEIVRVLRVGGRYVCVSLAQGHILAAVLRYFTAQCWMIRVCRVMEEREDDHELQLPVFVFVLTKFKKMPNMQSILEVSQFEDKVERYKTIEEVTGVVGEIQQYAIVRQQLNKGKVTGENISFDLYSAESADPRYTLHVVDCKKRFGKKFAIFIVPEGREMEWMFSTNDGREELCQSAGFERLVVVTLHRGHRYGNLDDVKEELSGKVMELAPSDIGSKQVPFLSVGDDLHCRTVRHQGTSDLSGDYVIEDIESDGSFFRRLIFLCTKTVVQTEAKLVQEFTRKKGKRKKGKLTVDPHYLSWSYSSVMLAGLAFLDDCQHLLETDTRLLLVGLGGGILPMFIYRHFPQIYTEVVEIDAAVASLATEWFGFVQDERMKLHVADGVDHVKGLAKEGVKKHVIMLDADSKDSSIGMSGPPQAFLERDFLEAINNVLDPKGALILNLICRDQSLRQTTLEKIQAVFDRVYSCKLQDDVNEVVFAVPNSRVTPVSVAPDDVSGHVLPCLDNALASMQEVLQKTMASSTVSKTADVLDLTVKLAGLSVV